MQSDHVGQSVWYNDYYGNTTLARLRSTLHVERTNAERSHDARTEIRERQTAVSHTRKSRDVLY